MKEQIYKLESKRVIDHENIINKLKEQIKDESQKSKESINLRKLDELKSVLIYAERELGYVKSDRMADTI